MGSRGGLHLSLPTSMTQASHENAPGPSAVGLSQHELSLLGLGLNRWVLRRLRYVSAAVLADSLSL